MRSQELQRRDGWQPLVQSPSSPLLEFKYEPRKHAAHAQGEFFLLSPIKESTHTVPTNQSNPCESPLRLSSQVTLACFKLTIKLGCRAWNLTQDEYQEALVLGSCLKLPITADLLDFSPKV